MPPRLDHMQLTIQVLHCDQYDPLLVTQRTVLLKDFGIPYYMADASPLTPPSNSIQ
jgi:hypothetical protein